MKNLIYLCSLFVVLNTYGQTKVSKPTQTIKTGKDVTIDLNTNNVNLEFDTWNKDYVEIESYLESETLFKEELLEELKKWDVSIESNRNEITITSKGNSRLFSSNSNIIFLDEANNAMKDLKIEIADMPMIQTDMIELKNLSDFKVIELPEMPELPELPELPEGNYNIEFDSSKYKKEGKSYLEDWSKNIEKKFGKDYQKKMQKWAEEVSKINFEDYNNSVMKWSTNIKNGNTSETLKWSSNSDSLPVKIKLQVEKAQRKMQDKMQNRNEALIKRQEKLQEARVKRQVILKDRLEKRQDKLNNRNQNIIIRNGNNSNSDVKRTIKIKMPKKAKLKMDVKHGELKLSSIVEDLQATLAYSNLNANRINGSSTSINTSFSNVNINHWDSGTLKLDYVESAILNKINTINLTSKSSNVFVDEVLGNALIKNSLGDLTIKLISPLCTNLELQLNASDALINLPNDMKLIFTGQQSKLNNEAVTTKILNNSKANKEIKVSAKFSKVYTK